MYQFCVYLKSAGTFTNFQFDVVDRTNIRFEADHYGNFIKDITNMNDEINNTWKRFCVNANVILIIINRIII